MCISTFCLRDAVIGSLLDFICAEFNSIKHFRENNWIPSLIVCFTHVPSRGGGPPGGSQQDWSQVRDSDLGSGDG